MGRLFVVGSSNTDLVIQAPRVPAPGETVLGTSFAIAPGGKGGNQAVAAARAGAEVTLVACVGDDDFGAAALAGFRDEGIDTTHCRVLDGVASGVAQIVVADGGENSIAVAPGANALLDAESVENACEGMAEGDWLLLQLEIPLETVLAAAQCAHGCGARVLLDPAPALELPPEIYPLVQVLTPNETEVHALTGVQVTDEPSAHAAAAALHARGVDAVVITRGATGVYCSAGGRAKSYPAYSVAAVDTTAAGDAVSYTHLRAHETS